MKSIINCLLYFLNLTKKQHSKKKNVLKNFKVKIKELLIYFKN